MRKFTSRQKAVLGVLAGLLAALLTAIVAMVQPRAPREEGRARTIQTIPDAEQSPAPDSKKEAYRGGMSALDGYWDSLEDSGGLPETELTDDGRDAEAAGGSVPRARALTYDDITDGTDVPAGRMEAVSAGRTIRDDPQRQALLQAIAEQEERQRRADGADGADKGEEEPERMSGVQSQIRRTGAISSLDGDPDDEVGTGFSSLDDRGYVEADASRPYRCMFARSEKVRSGQRVSVRLLEDVVVDGTLVPRNTRLSAVCTIGRRMEVAISTIEVNGRIHAVSFDGYDTDGTKGIYCSDLVETRKQARSQGISSAGSILSGRSMAGIARDAASLGLAIAQSASGETTVSIPEGYVFYLVQKTGEGR